MEACQRLQRASGCPSQRLVAARWLEASGPVRCRCYAGALSDRATPGAAIANPGERCAEWCCVAARATARRPAVARVGPARNSGSSSSTRQRPPRLRRAASLLLPELNGGLGPTRCRSTPGWGRGARLDRGGDSSADNRRRVIGTHPGASGAARAHSGVLLAIAMTSPLAPVLVPHQAGDNTSGDSERALARCLLLEKARSHHANGTH